MTFPIQLAAIGAGVIFALYLIFKERNTARPLHYDSSSTLPDSTYKPPSYDTHPLSKRNNDFEKETCVICYNDISDNQRTKQLRCKHVFHEDCIKKWMRAGKFCPICRETL